jgi:hypothetical protein
MKMHYVSTKRDGKVVVFHREWGTRKPFEIFMEIPLDQVHARLAAIERDVGETDPDFLLWVIREAYEVGWGRRCRR